MSFHPGIAAPPVGGHLLPAHLSGAPVAPAPRRRRRGPLIGILGSVAVVVAAGATFGALQVTANLGYDDVVSQFHDSVGVADELLTTVGESTGSLKATTETAGSILEYNSGALVDAATSESLTIAVAQAGETAESADALLSAELPTAGEKPGWFWELFAASERLEAERGTVEALADDLDAEAPAVAEAERTVSDSGIAMLTTAATSAATFEAAHISARNIEVIALRDAATTASTTTVLDQAAVDRFAALDRAAAQVVASEQAELAEKAGPLEGVRLEIEAFARALAPGVLLEFDWNTIVNGAGYNGSMGGLTTWWWNDPDRAVIELSNSVAEQWPDIRSKSLVAHEVGHAISVKCEDMYDSSTQDSIEKWATAWAISMGYTDDANGVWAYGYPPQSYIDAAAGCR